MSAKKEKILMFMAWLIYTTAYLGRYSYNSNVVPIASFYNATNTDVGLAMTFFFFAYGAGQIINGLLCKYYNFKYALSGALFVSSIINLVLYFNIPLAYVKYLWLLNGAVQSILWSTLLLMLAKNLDGNFVKKSVVVMSTTASIGTFLAYGLSALLAKWSAFRYSFFIASVTMFIVATVWFFMYDGLLKSEQKEDVQIVKIQKTVNNKMDKSVIYTLIIFGIFAVIINFIKDGLTSWVPKILKDSYKLSDSLSILVTLLLPTLAVFGTAVAVTINKKIKQFSSIIGILFLVAFGCVGGVVGFLRTPYWIPILLFFGVIVMLMSGSNNVVTSMLPLSMREKANTGLIAGLVNGCCYLGSTLSTVVMGVLADRFGSWTPVFNVLFGMSFVPVALAIGCAVCRKLSSKKQKG